jgi:hypothetical protein
MSTVKLSLVERTLNALNRCQRDRGGDILSRQAAEADVLRKAFDEVRAEERAYLRRLEHAIEQLRLANVEYEKAEGVTAIAGVAVAMALTARQLLREVDKLR